MAKLKSRNYPDQDYTKAKLDLSSKSEEKKDYSYYEQLVAIKGNSAFMQAVEERKLAIILEFGNLNAEGENSLVKLAILQGRLSEWLWFKNILLKEAQKLAELSPIER